MAYSNGFYDCDKRLRTALRVLEEAPITERNRTLIKDYVAARRSDGVGVWQVIKTLYHVLELAKILSRDFHVAERDDIARMIATIEGRPYSAWTKSDYRVMCKRFYRWLRQTEDYPPEVRWIKCRVVEAKRKLPEELLTATEVQRMIQHADLGRDRALIGALYETGCRVGEIGQLLLRHVEFDAHGARVIVTGKTGMRRVRVVRCVAHLRKWLDRHPLAGNPDAPLWVGLRGKNRQRIMTRDAIARVLERAARAAGIKKRIHPHLFRHSRATDLAAHLTEAQLKEVLGWSPASGQTPTYVHLSGRNVDEAVLRTYQSDAAVPPNRARTVPATEGTAPWQLLARLLSDKATVRFLARRSRQLA